MKEPSPLSAPHFAGCGGCGGLANKRSILVLSGDTTAFVLGCTRALPQLGHASKNLDSGSTIKESDIDTIVSCPLIQLLVHLGVVKFRRPSIRRSLADSCLSVHGLSIFSIRTTSKIHSWDNAVFAGGAPDGSDQFSLLRLPALFLAPHGSASD